MPSVFAVGGELDVEFKARYYRNAKIPDERFLKIVNDVEWVSLLLAAMLCRIIGNKAWRKGDRCECNLPLGVIHI